MTYIRVYNAPTLHHAYARIPCGLCLVIPSIGTSGCRTEYARPISDLTS